jgi:hypothetical protein
MGSARRNSPPSISFVIIVDVIFNATVLSAGLFNNETAAAGAATEATARA